MCGSLTLLCVCAHEEATSPFVVITRGSLKRNAVDAEEKGFCHRKCAGRNTSTPAHASACLESILLFTHRRSARTHTLTHTSKQHKLVTAAAAVCLGLPYVYAMRTHCKTASNEQVVRENPLKHSSRHQPDQRVAHAERIVVLVRTRASGNGNKNPAQRLRHSVTFHTQIVGAPKTCRICSFLSVLNTQIHCYVNITK